MIVEDKSQKNLLFSIIFLYSKIKNILSDIYERIKI